MRIRPNILDILELASEILRNEFSEDSYDKQRYETQMIANAITIAARQLEFGNAPEHGEAEALLSLLNFSGTEMSEAGNDLSNLFSIICKDLRRGKFDKRNAQHTALRRILCDSAYQLIREYNPKYLKENMVELSS